MTDNKKKKGPISELKVFRHTDTEAVWRTVTAATEYHVIDG